MDAATLISLIKSAYQSRTDIGFMGSHAKRGDDSSPHLILSDFLQEHGDPRYAIVRGHPAFHAMEKKYNWVTNRWKLLDGGYPRSGTSAWTMGTPIPSMGPAPTHVLHLHDGTQMSVAAASRNIAGKTHIVPVLGWNIPTSVTGENRHMYYASPLSLPQAKEVLAEHLTPEHFTHVSKRLDEVFNPNFLGKPPGTVGVPDTVNNRMLHQSLTSRAGARPITMPHESKTPHLLQQRTPLLDKIRLARKLPEWVPKETPGKEETTGFVPVSSSWIAGLKHTDRGSEMVVKKGGKSYPYPGINLAMFRRWVASKSKGKWWWRNIGHVAMSKFTGQGIHPLFNAQVDGPAQVNKFSRFQHRDIMDWFRKYWGPHVTPEHVAAMTGWVPGTEMTAHQDRAPKPGETPYLNTSIGDLSSGKLYQAMRTFGVNPDRSPYIHNSVMSIPNKPGNMFRGVSAPVYLRQLRAAYEMGVHKVQMHAIQSDPWEHDWSTHTGIQPFNGGRHWAAIGADGVLPEEYVNSLPNEVHEDVNRASGGLFQHTQSVKHLFMSPLGKEHFLEHPTSFHAELDTTPGSYSRTAIERHVNENAARFGLPPATPDASLTKRPLTMAMKRKKRYHPMTEYLYDTGSLHPDHFDQYFET